MKKLYISLLSMLLSVLLPLSVNAQEVTNKVNEGYTNENVYYSVYEIETKSTTTMRAVGDTITVLRKIQYNGIVLPTSQLTYSEKINGIYYTGTLTLQSFEFENGNTIALYSGKLTAIN